MTAQINQRVYASIFIAIWVLSLALSLIIPASWDVAWRMEIAERILQGKVLYRDIIEVNPPLWFWSAVPSAYLAKLVGISSFAVMAIAVHIVALVGIWLLWRCVEPFVSRPHQVYFLFGVLVAMVIVPTNDIGQRDMSIFLAGLLWGGLLLRRLRGIVTPLWLVLGITIFSAYGFALKHYYLLIPIALELWLIVQQKRSWRPFRVETIMLAGLGGLYAAAVLTFAPNFLPEIVPFVSLSYDAVRSGAAGHPLLHLLSILVRAFILVVPFYFFRELVKRDLFAQVCFILICVNVAIILIQGKGFDNHYLAARATSFLLCAYACGYAFTSQAKPILGPKIFLAIFSCGLALSVYAGLQNRAVLKRETLEPINGVEAVFSIVSKEPKSAKVFVASTNVGLAFFVQWYQDRPHFSRYYGMWMIPGLLTSQLNPDKRLAATAQLDLAIANTQADIMCAAPTLIVGDTTTYGRTIARGVQSFDVKPMTVLQSSPAFKNWLATNYNQSEQPFGITLWRSKAAGGPAKSNCP
jgi:hypothetical protein